MCILGTIFYQLYGLKVSPPISWVVLSFFFVVSSEVQILIFIKSSLSTCSFVIHSLRFISEKIFPDPKSWRFTPVFSSKTFIVWILIGELWYILSWFFSMWYEVGVQFAFVFFPFVFHFFACGYLVLSTICWKGYSFSTVWSWHPCWKSIDHSFMDLLLNSQFYSIHPEVCPYAGTTLVFDYCSFVKFVLLLQDYFGYPFIF